MMNQRWNLGRASYRPSQEPIRPSEFEVAPIAGDNQAKAFVTQHHYSRKYVAARFRYGLYRRGELAGVAVFSVPCHPAVLTNVFPGGPLASTELGRFVLLDSVGGNGETWFLARCFELLSRKGIQGVVSFSDPLPRRTSEGTLVLPGHVGTIYQAHNGIYLGRGRSQYLNLLPDATSFNRRTEQKIRHQESGWRYAIDQLVAAGADPIRKGEEPSVWVSRALGTLCRRVRHAGNHKYCWALNSRLRRFLPSSKPFPKMTDKEVA